MPQEKKRLRLRGISKSENDLSGDYVIRLIGEYCSFDAKVKVIVHKAPTITIKPKGKITEDGGLEIAFKIGSTLKIITNIIGGSPVVEVCLQLFCSDFFKKNSKL